ncbi:hypothetical protein [Sporolactobacillus putidus]|uniref:Uncharacterized protein n=1 Tax=Sporolactobacillus putidus TaxID=492735 RepID=A0A917W4H0_9BACL|nr:hypothetical protein [Sporolactobacillus putidus]GGL61745.1 hypothetical protein GCM10007968_27140 [Sporolactobacillus putidus]
MILAKLAKTKMECWEGTNHVWIHIDSAHLAEVAELHLCLYLPEGLRTLRNLNGYPEDKNGTISITAPNEDIDLIIEIYTEGSVPHGKVSLSLDLSFNLQGQIHEDKLQLPLIIVPEEMSEQIRVDPEVAAHVMTMKNLNKPEFEEGPIVIIPPTTQLSENKLSPLEKKYRIDGCVRAI